MYHATIGMEVHAELKTKSKMFCACKNDPDNAPPNTHICPVCMAHPGALPTINKEAVMALVKIGLAVGGRIATDYTEFDRKNYFYPDLPKGYQVSQYQYPLVQGGVLAGVALTRIHLEEDTARSIHDQSDATLVDFNRSGVPLMELVTEPVITSAEQAVAFAKELQLLLRTLAISDAHMEKGQMRVEANVSVSKDESLGVKVEIKNLNSFRAVERAVAYEIKRQIAVCESGEEVQQETRGWDEKRQRTFSQRLKEEAADYRYFPEPDLPKLRLKDLSFFDLETVKKTLPELPWQRRERLKKLGISKENAAYITANKAMAQFVDKLITDTPESLVVYMTNVLINDVGELCTDDNIRLQDDEIANAFKLISEAGIQSRISSNAVVELAHSLLSGSLLPEQVTEQIAERTQISDHNALSALATKVIEAHPEAVAEYKAGKEKALMFLVGQGMKESRGKADPKALAEAFKQILS